jgi:hypothetical protein
MKKIIVAIFLTFLTLSTALARDLTVTFVYPVEKQSDVAYFRLYRDGVTDKDNVPFDVRTFTTLAAEDTKDHIYTIQAIGKYNNDGPLSTPYTLKWTPPVLLKPTYLKLK